MATDNTWFRENISKGNTFFFNGIIFGLCKVGHIVLKIDSNTFEFSVGDFVTILPNRLVEVIKTSDDFHMTVILISIDFLADFPTLNIEYNYKEKFDRHPFIKVSEEKYELLLRYFNLIIEKCTNCENQLRENIVKYLLYSMMMEIIPLYNHIDNDMMSSNSSKENSLTKKFLALVRTHFRQEHRVDFYADKLCISPKYLSQRIKELTGNSVHQIINENIVTESKVLLKTTDQSIIEISETLNFTNPSFFIKFFKSNVGITPLKYRNNNK